MVFIIDDHNPSPPTSLSRKYSDLSDDSPPKEEPVRLSVSRKKKEQRRIAYFGRVTCRLFLLALLVAWGQYYIFIGMDVSDEVNQYYSLIPELPVIPGICDPSLHLCGWYAPKIIFSPFPLPLAPLAANADNPNVAWLMGMPNSGKTAASHFIRDAADAMVATNYAHPGKPTFHVVQARGGENGPFLDLGEGRVPRVTGDAMVLTRTHCAGTGICSGEKCKVEDDIVTPRFFLAGCLSGTRTERVDENKTKTVPVTYSPSLVSKAVHMFRHPIENVVARFEQENLESILANASATDGFSKYEIGSRFKGYREWCEKNEARYLFVEDDKRIDSKLRDAMNKTPCFHEYYRYAQWHNLAFSTTRGLNLPSIVVHQRDFEEDLVATRDRILSFLNLPLVNRDVKFIDEGGKPSLGAYMGMDEKRDIRDLIKLMASAETWEHVEPYFQNL